MIFPAQVLGVPNAETDDVPRIVVGWNEEFEGIEELWHQIVDVRSTPDAETLVFQRPLHSKYQRLFPLLKQRGHRVVVDLDDHFERVDNRNGAWYDIAPGWIRVGELNALADRAKRSPATLVTKVNDERTHCYVPDYVGRSNWVHMAEALKHADLITCSTPELADYYRRYAPTKVLRNGIPESYLGYQRHAPPDPMEIPTIVWTGSVRTHPRDLLEVGPALAELRREGVKFKLRIVGTGVGVAKQLQIPVDEATGWVEFEDYPREYSKADIAICPLEHNAFNRGKSWLKPLEAAAVGVVPVMSDLPEYLELNKLGVGYIAKKPRQWKTTLRMLIENVTARRESAEQGGSVASRLTYESRASEWSEAWDLRDRMELAS